MNIDEIKLRPELLHGPNPFIQEGASFVPFNDWPAKLRRYPLHGTDWRSIPAQFREPLLERSAMHFAPYGRILEPAADLQKIFRAGLARRNPLARAEQIRTLKVATASDRKQLLQLSPVCGGAGGGIWSGMTATGRTELFKRVMEIIAPNQVMTFGPSEACGWDHLTHVSYLHVDFASNGSRGGFLKRVLLSIDKVTGSSLSDDFRRVTNIDVLLVEVCRQLSNLRCVLIAIDEKQGSNFEDSPWKVEFLLFYLSLMNLGVNVLMLGNPLAFVHLRMFSQVMRRFSEAGQYEFFPAATADEVWWSRDFMPRMRKFNLVENWTVDTKWQQVFEFENTGGIQGLGSALHTEVQLNALRRAGSNYEATVTEDDYRAAVSSARFSERRRIALSVLGTGTADDQHYTDLPTVTAAPGTVSAHADGAERKFEVLKDPTYVMVSSLLAKYMRDTTRHTNGLREKLKSLKGLDADDIRMLGVSSEHLAEMQKMVDKAEATKAAAKAKTPSQAKVGK